MKKVLITGGPVHAYLDDVKLITNRFKGGRMWHLATRLLKRVGPLHVTYLCPKHLAAESGGIKNLTIVTHDGIEDYYRLVLELAPEMDAIILGAAVANLIPVQKIVGKFPSHNYKPGDIIPIDFKIAPRVIDEVKKVAPKAHLFGFKLLSGVSHDELIRAAYGIVLEAKATAVIANDAKDLDRKFVVTKERGVHPMKEDALAFWIWEMLSDEYYSTVLDGDPECENHLLHVANAVGKVRRLIKQYEDRFVAVEGGLIFGTVAARCGAGFITTGRGKHELESFAEVLRVDQSARIIHVTSGKASLNAPLLAKMFENRNADHIVHYHEQVAGLPTYQYAPPGTVRDSYRPNRTSFNIAEHGCMLLFDKNGRMI